MTVIGKIFAVAILMLSLVAMAFAVLVYSAHKNWRDVVMNEKPGPDKPLGLVRQLKDAKDETERIKQDQARVADELASVKAERRQALAKLEEEKNQLKDEVERLQKSAKELADGERQAAAAMAATQKSQAELRTEVTGLREDVRKTEAERDTDLGRVVTLTDELHQSVNELKRLKEINTRVAADYARAKKVMEDAGLNPDAVSNTPPRVEGLVLAVHGNDLVELSIGSDDGLQKGHHLEVYRVDGASNPYLGRIEILRTEPDKAVARIDPNYRKGAIQKGDRVASKLN